MIGKIRWTCLLMFLANFPLKGEVTERVYINHYFVEQADGKSLQQATYEASPINRNGKTYYGHTEWTVLPKYRYAVRGRYCYVMDVSVHLKIKFVLPKLHMSEPNPETETRFNEFYDALKTHEEGHKDLSREAAEEIATLLDDMPPELDCSKLSEKIRQHIQSALNDAKKKHAEYDRSTGYGRTQGAVIR